MNITPYPVHTNSTVYYVLKPRAVINMLSFKKTKGEKIKHSQFRRVKVK